MVEASREARSRRDASREFTTTASAAFAHSHHHLIQFPTLASDPLRLPCHECTPGTVLSSSTHGTGCNAVISPWHARKHGRSQSRGDLHNEDGLDTIFHEGTPARQPYGMPQRQVSCAATP